MLSKFEKQNIVIKIFAKKKKKKKKHTQASF